MPKFKLAAASGDTKIPLVDIFFGTQLAASKGEARRLIEGGGAKFNDEPVKDVAQTILAKDFAGKGPQKVSAGKKKHALLEVEIDASSSGGAFAFIPQ